MRSTAHGASEAPAACFGERLSAFGGLLTGAVLSDGCPTAAPRLRLCEDFGACVAPLGNASSAVSRAPPPPPQPQQRVAEPMSLVSRGRRRPALGGFLVM